jgi:uncharacterized protein YkwD
MHPRSVIPVLAATLAFMLTVAFSPADAVSARAVASAAAASPASYAGGAFTATNEQRASHDRSVLKKGRCLQRFAARQATRMANQKRMFHQDLGAIQKACHVGWVGENVAVGFRTGRSLVNQGWMKSEGHRANILSRHYRRMGLAARQSSDGTWWAAQVFGRAM